MLRSATTIAREARGWLAASLLSLLAAGCAVSVTTGITNGGIPHPHDGGSSTGGAGLPFGAPCTSNAACSSSICGLAGSGLCCAQACPSTVADCAASGCDDAGACDYAPSGTACGTVTCTGANLTGPECDGAGRCAGEGINPCSDHFACNDAGTACLSSCTSSADCAKGTSCNRGFCAPPVSAGPCTESDDCTSGFCGLDGGPGHCCAGPCPLSGPPCGAIDCDDLGSCLFPDGGTLCQTEGCVGSLMQAPRFCDGAGHCGSASTQECAPYACTSVGCDQSCSGDGGGCALGAYCDPATTACCPLTNGSTLTVDNFSGSDETPCCGTGSNLPCQTLTHAMKIIDAAQARNVSVITLDANPDWSMDGETVPILLGWGAELLVRSNTFFPGLTDAGARAIFEIGHYSTNDSLGSASIVGGSIGETSTNGASLMPVSILVDPGGTLHMSQSTVYSSLVNQTAAIEVAAGGSLVLGGDAALSNFGTVAIAGSGPGGFNGIVCDSDAGQGCTISDISGGSRSLTIAGQSNADIQAEGFSNITLLAAPLIGQQSPQLGYDTCLSKIDGAGSGAAVLLQGKAQMRVSDAYLGCIAGNAFELTASTSGVPSLEIDQTVIANTDCAVRAFAGTATLIGTTTEFNYNGVVQDTDGTDIATIDLSAGDAGANTIVCNDAVESSQGASAPGVAVLNATSSPLDARNVVWDTTGPDTYTCAPSLTSCACDIASCTLPPGADGMDAVSVSSGAITTTGNGSPPFPCTPPCSGSQCPGAQACCSGSCC